MGLTIFWWWLEDCLAFVCTPWLRLWHLRNAIVSSSGDNEARINVKSRSIVLSGSYKTGLISLGCSNPLHDPCLWLATLEPGAPHANLYAHLKSFTFYFSTNQPPCSVSRPFIFCLLPLWSPPPRFPEPPSMLPPSSRMVKPHKTSMPGSRI